MKHTFTLAIILPLIGVITAQPKLDVDIISGSISSNPKYYTEFQSKLYFQGYDGKNGRELWEYDRKSTPSMTADIYSGSNSNSSNPSEFCVFNNKLYFSATKGTDGYELLEYDGKQVHKITNIEETDSQFEFFINHLSPSTYIVKINTNNSYYTGRVELIK